jgi:histone deacetylase HOS3
MVQAASTNLHGPHGQFIENIHLDAYTNDEHFWQVLYAQKYSKIFEQAQDFLSQTGGNADNTLILISCGRYVYSVE